MLLAVAVAGAAPAPAADPDPRQVRDLVTRLDDDEFAAREQADQALRRLGKRAVPLLKKELAAARSEEVRKRLERIIDALAPEDRAVSALIKQLGDDEFQVREKASAALLGRGKDILPTLKKALTNSADAEVTNRLKAIIKRLSE
jgi:HEAT repeat protein